MEPIPESIATAEELGRYDPGLNMLGLLRDLAGRVRDVAPDCIGLSVAWLEHGVAFTLVATDDEIAVLDALQYLGGGPCVDGANENRVIETTAEELLDEERWHLFGRGAAHYGVASTLTMPLIKHGDDVDSVVGSVNLYGGSGRAFVGHHDELADILGGRASEMVRDADMSFSTRRTAEDSPGVLRAQAVIARAVGMVVVEAKVEPAAARDRLEAAAARAGVSLEALARALTNLPD